MKLTNLSDIVLQVLGEVIIFTMLYYGTNLYPGPHFHSPLPHYDGMSKISLFDAFYYSLTTQTTVGYGDLTARSTVAKMLTVMQLIGLLYIATGIKV